MGVFTTKTDASSVAQKQSQKSRVRETAGSCYNYSAAVLHRRRNRGSLKICQTLRHY